MQRWFFRSAVLSLAASAVLLSVPGCRAKQEDGPGKPPLAVRVTTPRIDDLRKTATYVGTVHAGEELRVFARIQGTVTSMPRTEGQRVDPGAVIAMIDAPELGARVERARADRDYWLQRHESDQRLVASGALPADQYSASLRAYQNAAAVLVESESALSRTVERSPVEGLVLSWLVEPGQHVMPGQPLMLLGGGGSEIHVEVVETDLRHGIAVGTPVTFTAGDGPPVHTAVAEVAALATGTSRMFRVKAPIPPEQAGRLRMGASVRMALTLASCEQCVVVPSQAVVHDSRGAFVFMVRDGNAARVPIEVMVEAEGLVGLTLPSERLDPVAITNLNSLTDGAAVYAVSEETAGR